jgi:hypothetical protein
MREKVLVKVFIILMILSIFIDFGIISCLYLHGKPFAFLCMIIPERRGGGGLRVKEIDRLYL